MLSAGRHRWFGAARANQRRFPENTDVELIGAIDDEGVKVGWIVQGFQLELLTERGPVLTSTVESVDVE